MTYHVKVPSEGHPTGTHPGTLLGYPRVQGTPRGTLGGYPRRVLGTLLGYPETGSWGPCFGVPGGLV